MEDWAAWYTWFTNVTTYFLDTLGQLDEDSEDEDIQSEDASDDSNSSCEENKGALLDHYVVHEIEMQQEASRTQIEDSLVPLVVHELSHQYLNGQSFKLYGPCKELTEAFSHRPKALWYEAMHSES